MSKTQLQKLRDAAALAYEAGLEVTLKTTDPDKLGQITDYFVEGACPLISQLDVLIGQAKDP